MQNQDKLYYYRAKVLRVVDGDTVQVDLDKGFMERQQVRLRLLGINAPELHSPDPEERVAALLAKSALEEMLKDKDVIIRTHKTDSFGRYLAEVWAGETNVNVTLLEKNLVKSYVKK